MNEGFPRTTCASCGNEIDPEWCWCGDRMELHYPMLSDHSPIPMGCDCGRVRLNNLSEVENADERV